MAKFCEKHNVTDFAYIFNVVKYILRHAEKDGRTDIEKALWYAKRQRDHVVSEARRHAADSLDAARSDALALGSEFALHPFLLAALITAVAYAVAGRPSMLGMVVHFLEQYLCESSTTETVSESGLPAL